ncbi:MAG: outer membrane lipoprotein carrier protein LolA [Desulfarculaceae bacterium]
MKNSLVLLILVSLLFVAGLFQDVVAQEDAAALATRIQVKAKSIDALSADYERTSRFAAAGSHLKRLVKGSGRLYWARELNLRLEQKTPRQELIVANAGSVWWVRPLRKQADRYPAEQFTGGLKPLLEALGGLARLDRDFVLNMPSKEENALGRGGPVLVLIPKSKRADLTRLIIWFDAQRLLLKGFRMLNLVGDVTEYRLTNMSINPSLAADAFTFSPAEDYKVRDHGLDKQ